MCGSPATFQKSLAQKVSLMNCDLSGKVSLVTGAARGIGQAIANRYAANGCIVYYTDLDAEEAKTAAKIARNGRGLKLDVTKSNDIIAAIQQVVNECGRLDILVNNAGV